MIAKAQTYCTGMHLSRPHVVAVQPFNVRFMWKGTEVVNTFFLRVPTYIGLSAVDIHRQEIGNKHNRRTLFYRKWN